MISSIINAVLTGELFLTRGCLAAFAAAAPLLLAAAAPLLLVAAAPLLRVAA